MSNPTAETVDDFHAFYHSVYGAEDDAFKGKPHGWIQWKGTQPCIDLHCSCGAHGHMDADFFFYHYKCAACGQKYALGQTVALIPLTEQQIARIEKDYDYTDPFQFDPDLLPENADAE